MISYQEAKKIIQDTARKIELGTENVPLQDAVGRICAEDIQAPHTIQPFDNAAMDGYVVRLADLEKASSDNPVTLKKSGCVAAGDPVPQRPLESGSCIAIMTGAPVPQGAEAIVPVEQADEKNDTVIFCETPKKNAHIRFAGEDFKKDETVMLAGTLLQTAHILPLATLGVGSINVYKKPRAVFLATGKELVDDLSAPLQSGQIYNSNRPYALHMLEALGVDCTESHTIPDNPAAFSQTLQRLQDNPPAIIISSGAVSAGAYDFVRKELEKMGADILFHKVKIKPGKPNLFAQLPNGTLYFGLPGNPVATAVGLRFFVYAAIRVMTCQNEEKPLRIKAQNVFTKKAGVRMFLKAKIENSGSDACMVRLLDGQASFMVSPFLNINAWAIAKENCESIKEGDVVDVYPFEPLGNLTTL